LGLLIEEQRTNLFVYSEQFDNAQWNKVNTSIAANTVVAPDGTITADTITVVATNGYITRSVTSVVSSTLSLYVKQGVGSRFSLSTSGQSSADTAVFNLSTATVITTGANNRAASITPVGNGWYRLVVTRNATAGNATTYMGFLDANATAGDYHYIWGAQFEAGAFATSYIPTVASQVTRAADAASMTGANFSSWYNQAQSTIYIEAIPIAYSSNGQGLFNLSDGTLTNFVLPMQIIGSPTIRGFGTDQTVSISPSVKFAGSYTNSNNGFSSFNGATAVAGTGGFGGQRTAVNQVNLFGFTGANQPYSGRIKKMAYYPVSVTNAQDQALTS
jgi:hypothetical protein